MAFLLIFALLSPIYCLPFYFQINCSSALFCQLNSSFSQLFFSSFPSVFWFLESCCSLDTEIGCNWQIKPFQMIDFRKYQIQTQILKVVISVISSMWKKPSLRNPQHSQVQIGEPFFREILNSSTWANMDSSGKDAYISYSATSSAL